MPFYRKTIAIAAASLVLPPVGLVLLWMRPGPAVLKKILGSLVIAAIGFAHLLMFYGLHLELSGGMRPRFSFGGGDSRYHALEANRAAQGAVAAAAPVASGSAYWADFRGPGRLGHYDQTAILTEWPAGGLRRIWRQPSGGGYASFSIAGGMAFTIEQRRGNEVAAAYDTLTGRELWTNSWRARFQETLGGDGPRATPVWDEGRVYALGAEGELRCLEAAGGKVVWNKNILSENGASNLPWGMAASPLIVGGMVVALPGGPNGRSVVAYDKFTGRPLWGALDDRAAYASPVVGTLGGRRQLLVITATRAVGLSLEEGKLLWEYPWVTHEGINATEPIIVSENRVYLSSGYGHGAAVLELNAAGEAYQVREVWANTRMKNKFNGAVLYQGYIYGLDEGILACLDAATGELKWKGGRYGFGQVLLASGRLVVLTEEGDVVLVRATPEGHQETARFAAIKGKTWNYPAISDGVLLVRNEREMAAFRIAADWKLHPFPTGAARPAPRL